MKSQFEFSISSLISVIAEKTENFVAHIIGLISTYKEEKPLLIVLAEHKLYAGSELDAFKGIGDALEQADSNPEQNVLLCSFMPKQDLLDIDPDFSLFMKMPNAYFSQLPLFSLRLSKEAISGEMKIKASEAAAGFISRLNHDLAKYLHENDSSVVNEAISKKEATIKMAKKYFPELLELTGRDLILKIVSICNNLKVEPVMLGKEIRGVYCDVEGTLLSKGIVNETVLSVLKTFESLGFEVTIWTLGDLSLIHI